MKAALAAAGLLAVLGFVLWGSLELVARVGWTP